MAENFDVLIVGAGPAGTSAALALYESGQKIALIDKSRFPRDKICGDALSPDVVSQLHKLPFNTGELFEAAPIKTFSKAVRFVSPKYAEVDVLLESNNITGYVSPRLAFDQFMYQQAIQNPNVTDFTGHGIKSLTTSDNGVKATLTNGDTLQAPIVLGADGAQSMVKRSLNPEPPDKAHYCAGLRIYYEGVTGFSAENAVELHFYKELLPGYFWVFPLPENRANVGIGMLSSYIKEKNINLKQRLQEIIATHPNVAHRFANAKAMEEPRGFPLPLGSKKRSISGDRYLLLGDAASLINPLSGEGIANAIRSGRVAADHLINTKNTGQYNAKFNLAYDREIYKRMWGELRLNYWMQILMRDPWRCSFIVEKALDSKLVQEAVMSGFNAGHLMQRLFKRH